MEPLFERIRDNCDLGDFSAVKKCIRAYLEENLDSHRTEGEIGEILRDYLPLFMGKISFSSVKRGKPIASGSYGSVSIGKIGEGDLVIKTVSSDVDTLYKEALTMKRCEGPYVGQIFEGKFRNDESETLLLKGEMALNSYIEKGMWKDERKSIEIFGGILKGIALIHERGVIHRDLKPGNVVLLTGYPMIIDFGFARLVYGDRLIEPDEGTTMIGDPNFNPPEIFDAIDNDVQFIPYGYETDMWSIGLIGLELLMGKRDRKTCNSDFYYKNRRNILEALGWKRRGDRIGSIIESLVLFEPTSRMSASEACKTLFGSFHPAPLIDPFIGIDVSMFGSMFYRHFTASTVSKRTKIRVFSQAPFIAGIALKLGYKKEVAVNFGIFIANMVFYSWQSDSGADALPLMIDLKELTEFMNRSKLRLLGDSWVESIMKNFKRLTVNIDAIGELMKDLSVTEGYSVDEFVVSYNWS